MNLYDLQEANLGQLNDMIDIVPASIYIKNLEGTYLNINQASLDAMVNSGFISGRVSKNMIIGKNDFDFFATPIANQYKSNDIETIRTRKTICREETIRMPNGDLLQQISTKKPLINNANEVIGIMGATIIAPEKNPLQKNLLSKKLSSRQKDCLHLYIQGKTSKETAYILGLSYRTVEWHIEQIKNKLNCSTKRDLFAYRNLI